LDPGLLLSFAKTADVVVVGIKDFDAPTTAFLSQIREKWTSTGIVVLMERQSPAGMKALAAFTAGVRQGYALLIKENIAGLDDLAHAVKAANEGRVVVDSAVMEALLHAGSRENTAYQRLSVREIEVLDLMAEGFRNKAIAASLNITDKTVERHIQSIYAKIGDPPDSIQPRAHAIAVYRQSGAPQAAARTR